jgi:spoIIIJ-associated protein
MIKYAEFSGKSEDEAIATALSELGLDRESVSIEVVERAKSGFLGIGSSPAKIRVEYQVKESKAEQTEEFLKGLFQHMGSDAVPQVTEKDDGTIDVQLVGESLGALIGRRGETLDAIQHLANYSVNRGSDKRVRINIDAEGYREKREESLKRLAEKVAGKVVKYRRNVTLEPMNSYERHVIHTALQDYDRVTTYSTGTEPNRRVVVAYDRTGSISTGESREWC